MADLRLAAFVDKALTAGASRASVESALQQAGWSSEQVADALAEYASVEFVVPVPRPRAQVSARDAFVYLVLFGTLYMSGFYLGDLLFQFVNLALPDTLGRGVERVSADIRWALAALIVSFPVFLLLSVRVTSDTARDPNRRTSAVRKWLTYLTLALAAGIIVGDLIYLLFCLLSGELTLRIVLKAAIVGLIAAAVFGYYLWAMKADDEALAR